MNELVVITPEPTQEYVSLVSHIANLWEDARNNAITAVNESLLMASWTSRDKAWRHWTNEHVSELLQDRDMPA